MTIMMGLSAATGLFGAMNQPKPPKAQLPAPPAPDARAPGAVVRIGQADGANNKASNTPDPNSTLVEKRATGQALGGLGRSGLAL